MTDGGQEYDQSGPSIFDFDLVHNIVENKDMAQEGLGDETKGECWLEWPTSKTPVPFLEFSSYMI